MTDEQRKRLSDAHKGYKLSEETKKRMSIARSGPLNSSFGKPKSEEHKRKISESLKGRKMPWVSESNSKRVYSNATREKRKQVMTKVIKKLWSTTSFRNKMTGENNSRWVKDRTSYLEKCRIRRTQDWKKWRESVFKRDDYTCQECGVIGGYLEPHHIKPIREDWKQIFEIKNGITLCRICHKRTMFKESNFTEKYLKIISEKMAAQE